VGERPHARDASGAPDLARLAMIIQRVDILSPTARALIAALNAELLGRYPEENANHIRLDADEVAEGRGAFLIAFRDDRPVGCGAVRRIDGHTGEIKRMYVCPEARGRGLGGALLAALETEARSLGLSRLVLETGVRQPEAIALYQRAGFARIGPFGEYENSPLSVFMAKAL
jgi:GNAT superfamily N-acetyltransferase